MSEALKIINPEKVSIRPAGHYILIEMAEVSEEVTDGALAGFKLRSDFEQKREQSGHDIGTVVAIGPLAYVGFDGCEGATGEERAASWGFKVGDTVEFLRYEGKLLEHPDYPNHRIIPDDKILMVVDHD